MQEGTYLLVATSGGYAKRTAIEEYTVQGRGGKGHPDDPVRPQTWHVWSER